MSFPKRIQLEGQSSSFTKIDFKNGAELVQNNETGYLMTHKNRKVFLELCRRAKFKGDKLEADGLKIELVGTNLGNEFVPRRYFKMQLADGTFFAKQMSASSSENFGGGSKEIIGMVEAEKLLMGLPGVEVVEYHVGYSDKYNSYLISRWDDSLKINLSNYLDKVYSDPEKQKEQRRLNERVNEIKIRLKPLFMDVNTYNMAYDEKNDKILIFDLIKKPERDAD